MLILQKHKELVFWLNLQYEQKVIFIKIFSRKKKRETVSCPMHYCSGVDFKMWLRSTVVQAWCLIWVQSAVPGASLHLERV